MDAGTAGSIPASIDWTKPLELLDGTPVVLEESGPTPEGNYWAAREGEVKFFCVTTEGRHWLTGELRVRNRATDAVTEERVSCAEGKFTVILRSDGSSDALRYSEKWPAYPNGVCNLEAALTRDLNDSRAIIRELMPYAMFAPNLPDKVAALDRARAFLGESA